MNGKDYYELEFHKKCRRLLCHLRLRSDKQVRNLFLYMSFLAALEGAASCANIPETAPISAFCESTRILELANESNLVLFQSRIGSGSENG